MYFFAETSKSITQSAPLGSWNVAGYQQVNMHIWIGGTSGSVYLEVYFNNYSLGAEKLTIPSGWSFAALSKTYPVYAPTLSAVLYNPSTPMNVVMRLYSACCESKPSVFSFLKRRTAAADGEAYRTLDRDVDMDSLLAASQLPPSERGATDSQ
jgi:hypothetical protein